MTLEAALCGHQDRSLKPTVGGADDCNGRGTMRLRTQNLGQGPLVLPDFDSLPAMTRLFLPLVRRFGQRRDVHGRFRSRS